MNEKHLDECLQRLDETRTLLDRIQTDLRGAQEFRDAVFDLLEGTPFGEKADSTYDGLYGRLRAALRAPETDAPQWQPALMDYLIRHEVDIFHGINDFGDLKPLLVLLHPASPVAVDPPKD